MGFNGKKLKTARELAKLTQEELGKKIGTTGVAIMRYEKEQREPKSDIVDALADALGVSVYYLYDLEISPKEIEKYVALHQLFKSHGYELISDYDAGDGKEWTLCVDNTKKELYLLSENTVEALERSIQDYAIFSINQVLKDAKKVKDTEGWFAKSPDTD